MNKNLFGTDGIRAKVGEFPLDLGSLITLGQAIGLWAKQKYGIQKPIVIGNDTRESRDFIRSALKTGMQLNGFNILEGGTIPISGVFQTIKDSGDHLGIVISASHNPHQFNGIKIFDRKEGKLSNKDEQTISEWQEERSLSGVNDLLN